MAVAAGGAKNRAADYPMSACSARPAESKAVAIQPTWRGAPVPAGEGKWSSGPQIQVQD